MLRWSDDHARHLASAPVSPPVFLEQFMTNRHYSSSKLNTATQSAPAGTALPMHILTPVASQPSCRKAPVRLILLASQSVRDAIAAAQADLGASGRLLIRASGTEPLIRVMAEGEDRALIERIAGRVASRIEQEIVRLASPKISENSKTDRRGRARRHNAEATRIEGFPTE